MASQIPGLIETERIKSLTVAETFISEQLDQHQHLNPAMRRLLKEIRVYLLRGGKWHRPWLTRLALTLLNHKVTPSLFKASLSTELLHRYILVHDDIIDQDLVRHDGPTLQKIYQDYHKKKFAHLPDTTDSLGHALIAGDVIGTLGQELVLSANLPLKVTLNFLHAFNQDFIDTAAGWAYETDLKQKRIAEVSEKEIVAAMTFVSARYSLVWPLRLGQILAGQPYEEWIPEIDTYGTQVGIAFQIQDDILAIFGDQKKTGKPVGNDLREGKKTLLTWYAYELADAKGKALLDSTFHQDISLYHLRKIQKLFEETGALSLAKKEAENRVKKGVKALLKLKGVSDIARNTLIDLAEFMIDRSQ